MNNEIITRLSKFAFVMSIIGICTLGICPAFAVMGITVGIVMKSKGVSLDKDNAKKIKTAYILGGISLALFAADIAVLFYFAK